MKNHDLFTSLTSPTPKYLSGQSFEKPEKTYSRTPKNKELKLIDNFTTLCEIAQQNKRDIWQKNTIKEFEKVKK